MLFQESHLGVGFTVCIVNRPTWIIFWENLCQSLWYQINTVGGWFGAVGIAPGLALTRGIRFNLRKVSYHVSIFLHDICQSITTYLKALKLLPDKTSDNHADTVINILLMKLLCRQVRCDSRGGGTFHQAGLFLHSILIHSHYMPFHFYIDSFQCYIFIY